MIIHGVETLSRLVEAALAARRRVIEALGISGQIQRLSPVFRRARFSCPNRNADLMHWCPQKGLRIVQPMTLMVMSSYQ